MATFFNLAILLNTIMTAIAHITFTKKNGLKKGKLANQTITFLSSHQSRSCKFGTFQTKTNQTTKYIN